MSTTVVSSSSTTVSTSNVVPTSTTTSTSTTTLTSTTLTTTLTTPSTSSSSSSDPETTTSTSTTTAPVDLPTFTESFDSLTLDTSWPFTTTSNVLTTTSWYYPNGVAPQYRFVRKVWTSVEPSWYDYYAVENVATLHNEFGHQDANWAGGVGVVVALTAIALSMCIAVLAVCIMGGAKEPLRRAPHQAPAAAASAGSRSNVIVSSDIPVVVGAASTSSSSPPLAAAAVAGPAVSVKPIDASTKKSKKALEATPTPAPDSSSSDDESSE